MDKVGKAGTMCQVAVGRNCPGGTGTCEPASNPENPLGDIHKTGCTCPHGPKVALMIETPRWSSDATLRTMRTLTSNSKAVLPTVLKL